MEICATENVVSFFRISFQIFQLPRAYSVLQITGVKAAEIRQLLQFFLLTLNSLISNTFAPLPQLGGYILFQGSE